MERRVVIVLSLLLLLPLGCGRKKEEAVSGGKEIEIEELMPIAEEKVQPALPTFEKVEGEEPPLKEGEIVEPVSGRTYSVQVASFRQKLMAQGLADDLNEKGYRARIRSFDASKKGRWYRVSVGKYGRREEASALLQELSDEFKDAIVIAE